MSYISVDQLKKTFVIRKKKERGLFFRETEKVEALKGVSFQAEQGELIGYIGPNGAGKSTTVKILSGILTPDSGSAVIGGRTPWEDRKEHVKHIGVVFGQRMQLWWDVPILDSFSLLRDIYRIPGEAYNKRLGELTDALELGSLLRTPLRQLSLGQRMRAELCGSLLHKPELLFLDEPTIGLDSVSKLALREFLKWENKERGTTVLLTTHDMEDIAVLCTRVMVLGHGEKLYDGAFSGLLSRYDTQRTIEVRFDSPDTEPQLPPGLSSAREGDTLRITYSPNETATAEVLSCLQRAGTIREMTIQPQNIDLIIAAMYRELAL